MCHVLIIEDEPLVAFSIQEILEKEGATSFDLASTETEAVQSAAATRPDVITSDVKLLEGNGPSAVAQILRRGGAIPVIFITGTPEQCKPCNPPGSIISKPFTAETVSLAFHQAML